MYRLKFELEKISENIYKYYQLWIDHDRSRPYYYKSIYIIIQINVNSSLS